MQGSSGSCWKNLNKICIVTYERDAFRTLWNICVGVFCIKSLTCNTPNLRCLTGFWRWFWTGSTLIFRSTVQRCSYEKVFWKSAANLQESTHGKYQCQSCFVILLESCNFSEACNFIKNETLAQVFSSDFCKISKNTFFTEYLWATASVISKQ